MGALLADEAAWERASEDQRDRARARLAAVRRAEELIARSIPRRKTDAVAPKEAGIARGVLGRWRRKVRGLPRGARVAALLDARRPGRPSLIDAKMRETLEALLFGLGDHLTAVHAHRTLLARHGQAPKIQTVRAWLRRWRRENARDLLAVTNPDLDRLRQRPAGGDAAACVVRLNQLWELHSTPADVICGDGKRYAIVAAIDIWSRQARVLVVPTSRATAIAALPHRCILEWGVPEARYARMRAKTTPRAMFWAYWPTLRSSTVRAHPIRPKQNLSSSVFRHADARPVCNSTWFHWTRRGPGAGPPIPQKLFRQTRGRMTP